MGSADDFIALDGNAEEAVLSMTPVQANAQHLYSLEMTTPWQRQG